MRQAPALIFASGLSLVVCGPAAAACPDGQKLLTLTGCEAYVCQAGAAQKQALFKIDQLLTRSDYLVQALRTSIQSYERSCRVINKLNDDDTMNAVRVALFTMEAAEDDAKASHRNLLEIVKAAQAKPVSDSACARHIVEAANAKAQAAEAASNEVLAAKCDLSFQK